LQNAPEVEAIALSPGGVHHHKPRRSSAASPQNTASFANLSREPSMGSDLNSLATSHISAAGGGGGGGGGVKVQDLPKEMQLHLQYKTPPNP
jgi:hypothetical protein